MAGVQNRISQLLNEALNEAIQGHDSIKQRYVRPNQAPFINKTICKEIMKRSRLRNKFLNTKSGTDRKAYNKQPPSLIRW